MLYSWSVMRQLQLDYWAIKHLIHLFIYHDLETVLIIILIFIFIYLFL